jgi:glycerol kinase
MVRFLSSILHFLTRSKQFKQGKNYYVSTYLVLARLLWAQKNYEKLKSSLSCPNTLFGMLDSWLLYKFKMGVIDFNENLLDTYEHISDISNSSVTGFFNPFEKKNAWWALLMFPINVSSKAYKEKNA